MFSDNSWGTTDWGAGITGVFSQAETFLSDLDSAAAKALEESGLVASEENPEVK
eukprot:Pgem_evm1s19746